MYPMGQQLKEGDSLAQRVLIVDDEPSITKTLAFLLRATGHVAATANSGTDALRLAEEFRPDTLITDFSMPGMNGLELAERLSCRFPACRVILFTGRPDFQPPASKRLPFYKLLYKPVPPDTFLDLLESDGRSQETKKPRHPRALCVDDVESHRYSVARFLRLAGFEVTEAATGKSALGLAESQPDVILLDIGLPDMSGLEVCRQLKNNASTAPIPVIHMTSSDSNSTTQEASRQVGAYDYLAAPYDLDHLLTRARSAVQVRYLTSPAQS